MTILVNYANNVQGNFPYYCTGLPPFLENQKKLNDSALAVGFDKVLSWDKGKLFQAGFVDPYKEPTVGDGYWSWKPFIILKALQEHPNEIVVYWDVGRDGNTFKAFPQGLINWCLAHHGMLPGVLCPCWGRQARWTHRDCFVYMDCDSEKYWESPQVQASFSVWQGASALQFLEKWVAFCGDPRICADTPGTSCGLPNFCDYREHRRDQSVLTNLCVKLDIEPLNLKHVVGDLAKDINNCNSELIQ